MESNLPLQDRVAIVTGASRGIGKAIALHLASLGAKLVINYTSESSQRHADELVSQINSTSPSSSSSATRAVAFRADVSDEVQVKALFDSAEQAFGVGQLGILVTSAGIVDPTHATIPETETSTFDRIMAVNTRGTFLCMQEGARRIKRGGGGRIVTITSSLVASLKPGYGAYAASKAAVEAMTKILAKELKGTGITANSVAPGPIATEMLFSGRNKEVVIQNVVRENPLGRMGVAEDVAPLVGFLVSDGGEWVNGQVVRVNGGYVS